MSMCPICNIRPQDTTQGPDARGVYWCTQCISEHDAIDWDQVAQDRIDAQANDYYLDADSLHTEQD